MVNALHLVNCPPGLADESPWQREVTDEGALAVARRILAGERAAIAAIVPEGSIRVRSASARAATGAQRAVDEFPSESSRSESHGFHIAASDTVWWPKVFEYAGTST